MASFISIANVLLVVCVAFVSASETVETTPGQQEVPRMEFSLSINKEEMTKHLKCMSCMTSCDDVRSSSLNYYFCLVCLEQCSGNGAAMMHHFVTRKCSALPNSDAESNILLPTEVLGEMLFDDDNVDDGGSGYQAGVDFLDTYLHKKHFASSTPKCKEDKELRIEYDNVQKRYGKCVTSLHECRQSSYEYGSYEYEDQERSARPMYQGGQNYDSEGSINIQKRLNQEILKKYSGRLLPIEEIKKIKNKKFDDMPTTLKAALSQDDTRKESEGPSPVCPSHYNVETPRQGLHLSRRYNVTLFDLVGYHQLFFIGTCQSDKAVVSVSLKKTECRPVKAVHKALFWATEEMVNDKSAKFRNCDRLKPGIIGRHEYLCDDWIRLDGPCSLLFFE